MPKEFLLTTALSLSFFSTSKANAKAFFIDDIEIQEKLENDFNKEKLINEGFKKALIKSDKITVFSHAKGQNNIHKTNTGIYFYDGFLNLDEIEKLKSNTERIILAGCETGKGFNERGEGIINTERAFLKNGVSQLSKFDAELYSYLNFGFSF